MKGILWLPSFMDSRRVSEPIAVETYSIAVSPTIFETDAYFALEAGCTVDESQLGAMRQELSNHLVSAARGGQAKDAAVLGIQYMNNSHQSIFGYDTPHTSFLQIYVSLPGLVPTLKRILEGGIDLPGIEKNGVAAGTTVFSAFEANVPFVLRFMVDRDISGAGWISFLKNTYQIRQSSKKETHCQVNSGLQKVCASFSTVSLTLTHAAD